MPEQTFASRLRSLREAAGLSRQELSRRAGLSHSAVAHLESGIRQPTLATARRLANVLGVSVEKL